MVIFLKNEEIPFKCNFYSDDVRISRIDCGSEGLILYNNANSIRRKNPFKIFLFPTMCMYVHTQCDCYMLYTHFCWIFWTFPKRKMLWIISLSMCSIFLLLRKETIGTRVTKKEKLQDWASPRNRRYMQTQAKVGKMFHIKMINASICTMSIPYCDIYFFFGAISPCYSIERFFCSQNPNPNPIESYLRFILFSFIHLFFFPRLTSTNSTPLLSLQFMFHSPVSRLVHFFY